LSKDSYEIPEGLYYSKDHEWAKLEGSRVRIGITDYAQKSLHDVVYVELPQLNKQVRQSDTIGAVESVKAASDVFAPTGGKVVEVNKRLEDEPELINNEPYGEGWIAMLEPANLQADLGKLMDTKKYSEFLKSLGK
jgi:glycine cleavage system H protein